MSEVSVGSKSGNKDGDKLEVFERKFVFRTARGYFLFLAVCAIAAFVFGVFTGARGMVQPLPDAPSEPALPPPPPEPEPLTLADVERWITKQESAPKAVESAQEPEWVASATDREKDAIDPVKQRFLDLLEAFKALFPAPTYAWNDTYVRSCARQSPYGCLRYDRQLDKEGVSNILEAAIRWELESREWSSINRILEAMIGALKAAPVERRGELIAPAAESYRELQGDFQQLRREHEREVASLRAEYEIKLAEFETELARLEAEKQDNVTAGIYGVLFGLALLILVSVFLAHFAIERHLRLLRETLGARS